MLSLDYIDHALPRPHRELEASVVVPCKDEAQDLEAALTALAGQVDLHGSPLRRERWEVILLINNSQDQSGEIAQRFRRLHPELVLHVVERDFPRECAHVGYARRLLMDAACRRLRHCAGRDGLIVSTDADTEVAPDWLAQNQAEIERGAGAVGGRISLRARDLRQLDAKLRRLHLLDDRYNLMLSWLEHQLDPQAHDPWPRHHQHFGASFAITADPYWRVGGLPPRAALEDIALYQAVLRQDIRFRHSPEACVRTSARLRGKTPAGLAHQLSLWERGPAAVTVHSVAYHRRLFSLRKRLRSAWQAREAGEPIEEISLRKLALDFGRSPDGMKDALECRWFGSAFEGLRLGEDLDRLPKQALEEAVSELQSEFFAAQTDAAPLLLSPQL